MSKTSVQNHIQSNDSVPLKTWLGFMSMVVGMFMAILDIQIVSSSLLEIQAGLSASSDEISWVQTSYLIAEVIMIPFSGFLSRLLSTRKLFLISVIGFTASSFLCALAWDINSMIIFRAIQGFTGGAMIPTVFSSAFTVFPQKQRTIVTVAIGLVATMAPTIGPTLGGLITDALSWHWLFLINFLPGVFVAFAVYFLVDFDKPDYSLIKGFDYIGLILMGLFLGTLQYVIEEGNRNDWFEDETIRNLAVISASFFTAFVWRVLTYKSPIVDLRAFTDRNFVIGCFFSLILGIGLYGTTYLAPLFLAQVRGYNSLQIGLIMMIVGIFQFFSAPIAGMLSHKFPLKPILFTGIVLFGYGLYLNSSLTNQSSFNEFFLPQAVRGISLLLCFIPINTIALGTLSKDKLKNASGLYNLMRNLGGAIGLAGINNIYSNRLAFHYQLLSEKVTNASLATQNYIENLNAKFGVTFVNPDQISLKMIANIVHREASIMAFNDIYLLIAFIMFGSLLLMPLLVNVDPPKEDNSMNH